MGCGRYRIDLEPRAGEAKPGTMLVHIKMRGRAPAGCVSPDFDHPGERCGRISVALCDEPLRHSAGTCSAPICERHRTKIGPDRDLCPRHVSERLPLEDATT